MLPHWGRKTQLIYEANGEKGSYCQAHLQAWHCSTANAARLSHNRCTKCGTSFLYRLLVQHPRAKPAFHKEAHYFDLYIEKGDRWYRSYFPLRVRKDRKYITGEASPYYLFHPHASRTAAVLPGGKLIVLLRNPIDRAYSHYQHQVIRMKGEGHETHPLEEAIDIEDRMLPGEIKKMLQDEHYKSLSHRNYSYLWRGIYVDQLLAWSRLFDNFQVLVLKSEDLFDNTANALTCILDFLDITHWLPGPTLSPTSANTRT